MIFRAHEHAHSDVAHLVVRQSEGLTRRHIGPHDEDDLAENTGRKTYKLTRSKREAVWPPLLEKALLQGLYFVSLSMQSSDIFPQPCAFIVQPRRAQGSLLVSSGFRKGINSSLIIFLRILESIELPNRSVVVFNSCEKPAL